MLANELVQPGRSAEQVSRFPFFGPDAWIPPCIAALAIRWARGPFAGAEPAMDPFREYVRSETRRQFLQPRGERRRVGGAWRRCWGRTSSRRARELTRRDLSRPHLPGASHFPPKAKHVIYLHMVGRPAADGPVRLQAGDERSGTTRTCPTRSAWASG